MPEINSKIIRSEDGKLIVNSPEYDTVKERLERKWFLDDKIVLMRYIAVTEYSEDFIHDLAKICSASIMSDSQQQDVETYVAMEICKEMNINWDEFKILLDSEIIKINISDYSNVNEYLIESQFGTQTKNSMLLFEAALHIILADGIMTDTEAQLLADITNILGIPLNKVIARISQFIRFEKEVLVDVNL